jgi:MFS family permease
MSEPQTIAGEVDTPYSWARLAVSLAITTIGGVGLWSMVVVMPAVEAEFGVQRAEASLPFTLLMVGFAAGGVLMGKLTDRFGIALPLLIGAVALGCGYVLAGQAETLWQFAIVHGVLIGFLGSSATFGPVIADVSRWFMRHRGIAVGIASCGSYLAGTVWPPIIQHFVETVGWRETHVGIGIFSLLTIPPLTALLRRRPPQPVIATAAMVAEGRHALQGVPPGLLQ